MCPKSGRAWAASTEGCALDGPGPMRRRSGTCAESQASLFQHQGTMRLMRGGQFNSGSIPQATHTTALTHHHLLSQSFLVHCGYCRTYFPRSTANEPPSSGRLGRPQQAGHLGCVAKHLGSLPRRRSRLGEIAGGELALHMWGWRTSIPSIRDLKLCLRLSTPRATIVHT